MSENIKKHLGLLGLNVSDAVTGANGVVTSVTFDLYGCIQALVHMGFGKDGEPRSNWFDTNRLLVVGKKPVMTPPDFEIGDVAEGLKGPAEKPMANKA